MKHVLVLAILLAGGHSIQAERGRARNPPAGSNLERNTELIQKHIKRLSKEPGESNAKTAAWLKQIVESDGSKVPLAVTATLHQEPLVDLTPILALRNLPNPIYISPKDGFRQRRLSQDIADLAKNKPHLLDKALGRNRDQDDSLSLINHFAKNGTVELKKIEAAFQSKNMSSLEKMRLAELYSTRDTRHQKLCRYLFQTGHSNPSLFTNIKSAFPNLPDSVKTVDYSDRFTAPPKDQVGAECVAEAVGAQMSSLLEDKSDPPFSVDYIYRHLQVYEAAGAIPPDPKVFADKVKPGIGLPLDQVFQALSSYPVPNQQEWDSQRADYFQTDLQKYWQEYRAKKPPKSIYRYNPYGDGPLWDGNKRPDSHAACLAMPYDKVEKIAAEGLIRLLAAGKTPVTLISSDGREGKDVQEKWLRPLPVGEFGHAINIVGMGEATDPFSASKGIYFLIRDSKTGTNDFVKMSAGDLVPLINGIGLVDSLQAL